MAHDGPLVQSWAGGKGTYDNQGVLADVKFTAKLALRAGLFRSGWLSKRDDEKVFDKDAGGSGALTV